MKLPIKNEDLPEKALVSTEVRQFDEFDSWGGAIKDGKVFVKECRSGNIVPKSKTTAFKRGVIKGNEVFYYLSHGDRAPAAEQMIPSVWS